MSIVSIYTLWSGRTGSDNIDRQRQYKTRYEVTTDNPFDEITFVGGSPLLPRLGDPYPFDLAAFCTSITPTNREETPFIWDVDVEYDTLISPKQAGEAKGFDDSGQPTKKAGGGSSGREENPLDRPAIWTSSYIEFEIPFVNDIQGNPILNSAGDPYDPPLMTKRRNTLITITKNVDGLSLPQMAEYADVINDAVWKAFPLETLKAWPMETKNLTENGYDYTEVTLRLEYSTLGWKRMILDTGLWTTENRLGVITRKRIRDPITGAESTTPQFLDGAGNQLEAGLPPVEYPPQGIDEFESKSFDDLMALLGIP